MSAWALEAGPTAGPTGVEVTLVEGSCFCIGAANGDLAPSSPHGLFFRDTRYLSGWQLRVGGSSLEPLAIEQDDPFSATFVTRARPVVRGHDSRLLVLRRRFVGNGMREDLTVQNMAGEPSAVQVELELDVDFAHIFDVKEGRPSLRSRPSPEVIPDGLRYVARWPDGQRELVLQPAPGAVARPDRLVFQVVVPAKGEWTGSVLLLLGADGATAEPHFGAATPVQRSEPVVRLASWRKRSPSVASGREDLATVVSTAVDDLGSLRIFDPEIPDRVTVAAGSPWFMTLFGRDSILTSWMALMVDPSMAVGTLRALADLQGVKEDPRTEEEPGRILHEVRWGSPLAGGQGDTYYGSVDATPLFVMLAAELRRWGLGDDWFPGLLGPVDRALEWIRDYGDRDGDGFVEYKRATDHGLVHQGWKDSFDAVSFACGRAAEPPVALCEVQGYVYAAYEGRALMAAELGDRGGARYWHERAASLKAAFNEAYWLPEHQRFALGLDADKRPIDALASNMGHCLWAGIVDDDKAEAVVRSLMSPEMFTGWGIRTLASTMDAYNPVSYHNGSVWPHDSALIAAGMMRYGYVEEAQRVAMGLIEAASRMGGRLPELFCGFDRATYRAPVAYPTSCCPQAWAAGSIFLVLRTLLGFEPSLSQHVLAIDPQVPEQLGELRIENIPFAGSRLTIEVTGGNDLRVRGLPPGIRMVCDTCAESSA